TGCAGWAAPCGAGATRVASARPAEQGPAGRPGRSVSEVERDYAAVLEALAKLDPDAAELSRLREHQHFVERESHWIAQVPSALWPLAYLEPGDSVVRQEVEARQHDGWWLGRPWLRLQNAPEHRHDAGRIRTLVGHKGWVYAVAVSADGRHALSG